MMFSKILIANRGEIAVRIARAAAELELETVAVFSEDDSTSLHARVTDEARQLRRQGPAAYLDIERLIELAVESGCGAIHPGYGFLSESATFARRAAEAGLVFIGPRPEHLELFGDKARARQLAQQCGVPLLSGTTRATTLDEARAFFADLGSNAAMMIKALAGGGGRGMRVVRSSDDVEACFLRCQSEAKSAFGNDGVYVERFMPRARHIEIQVIGDGDEVIHIGERECTIQRRNQKIVEIAPSPTLPHVVRDQLFHAAIKMAEQVKYVGLGTFEFLVDAGPDPRDFAFIEVNPRLQVEHTITEEVYGIDLVKTQIRIAGGASLLDLGLDAQHRIVARGCAIELRINMETVAPDGTTKPSGGLLKTFDVPSGPGVRVDTFGYAGYMTNPRYDSLLAKVIVYSPEKLVDAIRRGQRALREFRIAGLDTNIPLLRGLLGDADFRENRVHTTFLEERVASLLSATHAQEVVLGGAAASADEKTLRRGELDPLSVFDRDSAMSLARSGSAQTPANAPSGTEALASPIQGTVISLDVSGGMSVRGGEPLLVIEAMKMEHVVAAPISGIIHSIAVEPGQTVFENEPLLFISPTEGEHDEADSQADIDLDQIRGDLREALARRAELLDENRPDAVARRRKTGQRTARENIADLCDPDSFVEYGGLAVAAQRHRRTFDELRRMSPADGMITGIGAVNGAYFGDEQSRCAVMAYDYTVFAGTQGVINHKKKDRLLTLADKWALPLVLFAEGGGGRPGDEWPTPAGLDTTTFTRFGALNGKVPTVGVVSGRCFAGNAALLGSCDVIIAAERSNIGMGGPAMIEGGGLGVFRPEDIGPMSVQIPNGVVDIAVSDEAEGVSTAKRYLSYFQGRIGDFSSGDQRLLRHAVPENRMRAYDIRALVCALADTGSVLELRPSFGKGMITAFIRIEGHPLGLIGNNSHHLGGAIDADGADKAARFIQLCDAFDIPVVSLCDTPGMMVGPEVEKTAQVRHVSRMFINAAKATIPFFTVVLRKGYGLGALAMSAGSGQASFFIVAWPSAEFGAMGLEGAIKLAYRKELNAIENPADRKLWFEQMVAKSYEENKALNSATFLEVDDVIDPIDTRRWIVRGLKSLPRSRPDRDRKVARIDAW
jgi:acetyl/propionyl-CoA carboxylase alpha subunit/acetyl-CoA carboxylase carboxyltransferase component